MLNIISRSIVSRYTRGPRKVVLNLLAGLSELNYPFVVNAELGATKCLWIHDDQDALVAAMELSPDVAIIAGPNIYTLPSEVSSTIDLSRIIWIHPAPWVEAFWRESGASQMRSVVWPTGIDTKKFAPTNTTKDLILVYNKQRNSAEVEAVCVALQARGENYEVLTYGQYQEEEYLELLQQSKAIVWVGRSESQGIGLLEALAINVPALVWDVSTFGEWEGVGHDRFTAKQLAFSPVTAAPYFDDTCGLKFTDKDDLGNTLDTFLEKLPAFRPRAYIEKGLSLSKQATDFLELYKNHFGQTNKTLKDISLLSPKKWKNASWCFYVATRLKDAVRLIIR